MTGHAGLAELVEAPECPCICTPDGPGTWFCTHHVPSAPGLHLALGDSDHIYHAWRDLGPDALAQIGAARALRSRLDGLASGERGDVHPVLACRCEWCSLTRDAVDLACKLAGAA